MADSFNGIVIEEEQTVDQALELQNLQVTGNCYFMDTVEADRIEIDGVAKFRSFVTCDRLWVPGEAQMMQRLLTETMQVSGGISVLGRCWADVAVFEGQGLFHGVFSTGRLLIKTPGTLEVTERLKADRVTVNGQLRSSARLSCREAEFISCTCSSVHQLTADSVKVACKVRPDQLEMGEEEYILLTSFMDAGTVSLEHAYVEQLFCDVAVIGKGCRIRELIYRDGVEIDSGAIVERVSKA